MADQHHHKFIVYIFCDCRSYLQVANELRKNRVLMYVTLNYIRELTGYVCCYKVLCCYNNVVSHFRLHFTSVLDNKYLRCGILYRAAYSKH